MGSKENKKKNIDSKENKKKNIDSKENKNKNNVVTNKRVSDNMDLGEVFFTGTFGEDCCPWGDLDQLIKSLESIAMDNNLEKNKLLITLRSHKNHILGSSKDCKAEDSNFGKNKNKNKKKNIDSKENKNKN